MLRSQPHFPGTLGPLTETIPRGELFILSAPSGAGKTTLVQRLMRSGLSGIAFSVSHTTRQPRLGEVDGKDYHFISPAVFDQMVADGRFLEWAEVHNHRYGTSYEEVFPRLERGTDVVLDIDVQGAEQLVSRCPDAHSIFVMPPSYDSLKERLSRRGSDDPATIAHRLSVSVWEIKRYKNYRYVIINDDADRACERLTAIILEKRHRQERIRFQVQEILKSFHLDPGST